MLFPGLNHVSVCPCSLAMFTIAIKLQNVIHDGVSRLVSLYSASRPLVLIPYGQAWFIFAGKQLNDSYNQQCCWVHPSFPQRIWWANSCQVSIDMSVWYKREKKNTFKKCHQWFSVLYYFLIFFFLLLILATPQGIRDLWSPTRDWTQFPCTWRRSLHPWTIWEVPVALLNCILVYVFIYFPPNVH